MGGQAAAPCAASPRCASPPAPCPAPWVPRRWEQVAILDLDNNAVVGIEPHREGQKLAAWTWQDDRVVVAQRRRRHRRVHPADGRRPGLRLRVATQAPMAASGRRGGSSTHPPRMPAASAAAPSPRASSSSSSTDDSAADGLHAGREIRPARRAVPKSSCRSIVPMGSSGQLSSGRKMRAAVKLSASFTNYFCQYESGHRQGRE